MIPGPCTPAAARAAVVEVAKLDQVAHERLVDDLCQLVPSAVGGLCAQYLESHRQVGRGMRSVAS